MGLERTSSILQDSFAEILISTRRLRQVESIQLVRDRREAAKQQIGFASRPFVLCGLPVRCPPRSTFVYERRNGHFTLQITGHPDFGLPYGQDRLVPIFLATLAIRQQGPRITFDSAAEMLDIFGMQQGGSQYRRLVAAFQRIFGATIFFGTDTQREHAAVVHRARFNFMSEARIWYSRDPGQRLLPGDCQNVIVLSDEFYREIRSHPIPADLDAAKVLSSSPAALDLFMWLSYRCFMAKGRERIPLFGLHGLANQLGTTEYARPRKFREKLQCWLRLVRAMWPGCPAAIDDDGDGLLVGPASAVYPAEQKTSCERGGS
ncbi:MAG: replication initiator protein A [Acidobacteria bacterium]|nr:replication initiator protein A [Acidobacteriota bacterium]